MGEDRPWRSIGEGESFSEKDYAQVPLVPIRASAPEVLNGAGCSAAAPYASTRLKRRYPRS